MDELAGRRLRSTGLIGPRSEDHRALLRRIGAMQAQDHGPATWGLHQRTGQTQAELAAAFDRGEYLRTHVLRPTWHYVLPEDLPWLLELTAPRVHAKNGTYYRQLGLDPDVRARITRALVRAATQDGPLTRKQAVEVVAGEGVGSDSMRMAFLTMHAELEGALVSGPMAGKQQTLALFADRVPEQPSRDRDEALADLGGRFVDGHAPVTAQDFAWWSGLTVKDATRGLEACGAEPEESRGLRLWATPATTEPLEAGTVHLIQAYDEYLVGYARRQDTADHTGPAGVLSPDRRFRNLVLVDGRITGGWKATPTKAGTTVETDLPAPLPPSLAEAITAYQAFTSAN